MRLARRRNPGLGVGTKVAGVNCRALHGAGSAQRKEPENGQHQDGRAEMRDVRTLAGRARDQPRESARGQLRKRDAGLRTEALQSQRTIGLSSIQKVGAFALGHKERNRALRPAGLANT